MKACSADKNPRKSVCFLDAMVLLMATFMSSAALITGFTPSCPSRFSTPSSTYRPSSTSLSMDPALVAAAAGLAGSAAGWASRSSQVSDLQDENDQTMQQLTAAIEELNVTKTELIVQQDRYETALFEMDNEFEGETARIKKDFEEKLDTARNDLQVEYKTKFDKAKTTLEKGSKLKLAEREGKLRQEFLQDRLMYETEFNSRNANDVIKGLDRQSQLVSENQELKDSLDQVQADLKEIIKIKKGLM